jgi:hypothetical protein
MRRTVLLITFFMFLPATAMVLAQAQPGETTPMLGGSSGFILPGTAPQILTLQVEAYPLGPSPSTRERIDSVWGTW